MPSISERFMKPVDLDVADAVTLRSGSLKDYKALAGFHYLPNHPVTATRVLVFEVDRPTIGQRFIGCCDLPQVIGVLVESYPALSCALRELALGNRYRDMPDPKQAARLLNREMRCISRVVVHPQWRGLGLAVKLVRHALASMTTRYTEALAAMGQVHPFFRKAGMTEYRRWPHRKDQRLLDALSACGIQPWQLADVSNLRIRLHGNGAAPALVRRELARWAHPLRDPVEQLQRARDRLVRQPLYYLHARSAAPTPTE